MNYRYLGRSGLKVSRLCLGTMMFGGPPDVTEAHAIIAHAKANGVNFIDTADVYQKGITEEVVDRGIANGRDDWVLATKPSPASCYTISPTARPRSRICRSPITMAWA